MAGSVRALCQGNCAPNHYWDMKTNTPGPEGRCSSRWSAKSRTTASTPGSGTATPIRAASGNGFQLDDEKMTYPFYEKSKELGLKMFSVHKGFSSQSKTLGHLANPEDVEKAALDHPDLTFVIYHSAMQHAPSASRSSRTTFDPETGDFAWHDVLMKIKERNPQMNNVYPEIGSSFGTLAIYNPEMCQHLIGKNIKLLRRRPRDLGHRLPVVGLAAVGDRRLQAVPDLRRDVREVRLHEADQGRQGQDLRPQRRQDLRRSTPTKRRKNIPKDELSKLKVGLQGHRRHARQRRLRLGPRRRRTRN